MPTDCSADRMAFAPVAGRAVVAAFDGGAITSDAGALLLGAADRAIGLVRRFAACFVDHRVPDQVEHGLTTLVGQRVFALALGYEDLVDHDALRHDPVLAAVAGKLTARRSDCAALAGKSTLNRLEHAPAGEPTRYHKIGHDGAAIERLFVELFLDAHRAPPAEIVLDLDATDDPLHGQQEGRFFHGYYGCYCYLPLYVFCGDHLLVAKLRRSSIDASAGAVEEIARLVAQIRARWPETQIILRADSGFAREALMVWAEQHRVDYVLGLARNPRLVGEITTELAAAKAEAEQIGKAARCFKEFRYRTLDSWSCERRVVAKAEQLPGGSGETSPNPRFVVTSLSPDEWAPKPLYERLYCARGEMENRIKECQLDLFADRTSTRAMRANQLRLWFAAMAYVLLAALRRIALPATRLAHATAGTIRLTLLKIGALVRVSVRRITVKMASGHPWQQDWAIAHQALTAAAG
ncbi:MAG TPA: IS1380 family transposase [Ideonella sp.]|nr:IS1380 family transposase [Ideonella sp.]